MWNFHLFTTLASSIYPRSGPPLFKQTYISGVIVPTWWETPHRGPYYSLSRLQPASGRSCFFRSDKSSCRLEPRPVIFTSHTPNPASAPHPYWSSHRVITCTKSNRAFAYSVRLESCLVRRTTFTSESPLPTRHSATPASFRLLGSSPSHTSLILALFFSVSCRPSRAVIVDLMLYFLCPHFVERCELTLVSSSSLAPPQELFFLNDPGFSTAPALCRQ